MKPYKILIIEDDPVIQGEMETLLRGNGYTAVSVKDFSKVTDTFKAEEPHLILLDIKLPNESGFSHRNCTPRSFPSSHLTCSHPTRPPRLLSYNTLGKTA